jgi:shikimate dehydrogenase
MSPHDNEHLPIDFDSITSKHFIYDLVYNPEKTMLLTEAEKRGATIKNGLEMLQLQAEKSFEIWEDSKIK